MKNRALSVILLCCIFALALLMVVHFVGTGISLYRFENAETDLSKDALPGLSIIDRVITYIAVIGAGLIYGFVISSIGFFLSMLNTKIAVNDLVKRICTVFSYIYSVVALLIIALFSCYIFIIFM